MESAAYDLFCFGFSLTSWLPHKKTYEHDKDNGQNKKTIQGKQNETDSDYRSPHVIRLIFPRFIHGAILVQITL